MEKITKEELLEELKLAGLTDEDLAKIAGGDQFNECVENCRKNKPIQHCYMMECSGY